MGKTYKDKTYTRSVVEAANRPTHASNEYAQPYYAGSEPPITLPSSVENKQSSDFEERTLRCRDCNEDFLFKVGEQRFYAERGLVAPKRCKPCRAANRDRRAAEQG
jgi:hypothetical protein